MGDKQGTAREIGEECRVGALGREKKCHAREGLHTQKLPPEQARVAGPRAIKTTLAAGAFRPEAYLPTGPMTVTAWALAYMTYQEKKENAEKASRQSARRPNENSESQELTQTESRTASSEKKATRGVSREGRPSIIGAPCGVANGRRGNMTVWPTAETCVSDE